MEHKYILIEVIEREISVPAFFPTLEEAQSDMMDKFKVALGLDDEDLAEAEPVDGGFQLWEDCCFSERKAYGERHGQNFDWEIFEM